LQAGDERKPVPAAAELKTTAKLKAATERKPTAERE